MARRQPPKQRLRRLTPAERAAILVELRKDPPPTKHGLARQFNVSPTTIRDIARKAGLTIAAQSPELQAASDARGMAARATRSQLMVDLLEDAKRARIMRWAPERLAIFDRRKGEWVTLENARPAAKDFQAYSIGMAVSIDKALQLEKHDAEGPTAARAAIVNLVDQLHEEAERASKPRGAPRPGGKARARAKGPGGRARPARRAKGTAPDEPGQPGG